MKARDTLFGIALALLVLLSTAAPAFAAGGADGASDALAVDVEQGDDVVVTVTNEVVVNDTTTTMAVENATVTVDAANDSTYAANETFVTDANGSVVLPEPSESVTATVTATWNNSTATATVDLVATDEAADGDGEAGEADPYTFGQRLSAFIHGMLHAGDDDGPLGRMISEFARSNNPGADHRSERAAENSNRDEKATTGSTAAPGNDHTKEEREHGKQNEEKRNDHAKEHGKQKHDRNDDAETTEQDDDDGSDDHAEETTAERE